MPVHIRPNNEDMFHSGADFLVNPINCLGVNGKGLALRFTKEFPWIDDDIKSHKKAKGINPGDIIPLPYRHPLNVTILCFATKNHWRNPSKVEWIETGLSTMRTMLSELSGQEENVTIAMPAVGCGLGGLEWGDVLSLIIKYLGDIDNIDVLVYPPRENK